MLTPVLLGALSVLLAGPLPWALSRWTALRRTPAAAMLLWQSTALAAVLAALGAGLSLATDRLWQPPVAVGDVAVAALAGAVTVVVTARLLLSGHRTGTDLRRMRRRHRERVDLVARVDDGVSVLEHDLPVAYCVPGMSGSRIVVSRSTLTRLAPAELRAVLEHERSHLRARHDLVLEAFAVLHRAFPRWVASGAARHEVEVLVEVLADRAAVRSGDRRALVSALVALAGASAPEGALGSTGSSIAARVEVLRDTGRHRAQAAAVLVLAGAILALPTLLVVLPWLGSLRHASL
ncbi:Peptidase family M48 [Nocardioides alpinus]|uniref:Peptidase family M48 n=1 Tax=Nocardioides alpinus TaxID=748909 RepID=A0A1I1ANP0_9ACTN|nr:M56 family metallopeptidase [Nocardioides alpinus]PKH41262.1 Zn-dependent protease with chaperone function [Nocardioides alpinus]SFB39644.1 Peptidase family M48 [Nocardioides alpinus]